MADQGRPGNALLRVIQLREELDRIAEGLVAPQFFDPVSLPIPRLEPAELGFIRSVAYMFILYYEAGEVAVPYLLTLWDGFGLDGRRSA